MKIVVVVTCESNEKYESMIIVTLANDKMRAFLFYVETEESLEK